MPSSLNQAHPVMESTLLILRAAWNDKHSSVYQAIRQTTWPDLLKGLVQSYESMLNFVLGSWIALTLCRTAHFQNKTFEQLGLAYETIRPSSVADYLGVEMSSDPSAEVISTLTAKGWEWDPNSKLFYPKPSTELSTKKEIERLKIGELASLVGGYGNREVLK